MKIKIKENVKLIKWIEAQTKLIKLHPVWDASTICDGLQGSTWHLNATHLSWPTGSLQLLASFSFHFSFFYIFMWGFIKWMSTSWCNWATQSPADGSCSRSKHRGVGWSGWRCKDEVMKQWWSHNLKGARQCIVTGWQQLTT